MLISYDTSLFHQFTGKLIKFNNRIYWRKNMKKITEGYPIEDTEIKKKGRYEDFIKEMKTFENSLTFFNQLLDKALKTPNDTNINELEKYKEQLSFSDKPKGPQ
ncbi:Uncharacterised protein [Legionella sainthelensi]|nr:Uncharacterised protein [Legionella sainthelensi]